MDASLPAPVAGADATHPDGQYGAIAKLFHWTTVVLIAVALPLGFVLDHVKDEGKMAFYAVHESTGLTILIVAVLRLLWRRIHPPPPLPDHVPPPMRLAASVVHNALYALLILQPIVGFFTTNAWGFPLQGETAYLGLIDLPKFMEADEALAGTLSTVHLVFGWTLLGLILAHVCGVIVHHAIRRDGTLLRML